MRISSNNTIAAFVLAVLMISVSTNTYVFLKTSGAVGNAVSEATVSMCVNKQPVISYSCSHTAFPGSEYTCDIDAAEDIGQNLTFYDNSPLFDIDPATGLIRFTPVTDDIGTYSINITATDNSSCSNNVHSIEFNLTVSSSLCGNGVCSGAEDCSNCEADCGACPEEAPARGRGGGGGLGAAIFDIDFTALDSKIVTAYEGDSISFTFNRITTNNFFVIKVGEDFVEISIKSKEVNGTIRMHETKAFDMNQDSLDDISIELMNISDDRKARLRVSMLEGAKVLAESVSLPIIVSPDSINVVLRPGENATQALEMENIGRYDLYVLINISETLKGLVHLDIDDAILLAGQKKTTDMMITADRQQKLGVYNGMLSIDFVPGELERITKKIPVIIEIESENVLFDATVYIAPEKRIIAPGQSIEAQVTFFNLKKISADGITVSYIIKSIDGRAVVSQQDTISLEDQMTVSKSIALPEDIEEGDYLFIVEMSYQDSFSTTNQMFSVAPGGEKRIEEAAQIAGIPAREYLIAAIMIAVAACIAVALIFSHFRSKVSGIEGKHKEAVAKKIEELEKRYEDEYRKLYGSFEEIETEKIRELQDYVEKTLSRGFKEEHIRRHLKSHGWLEKHIESAMKNIRMKRIEKEIERLRDSIRK